MVQLLRDMGETGNGPERVSFQTSQCNAQPELNPSKGLWETVSSIPVRVLPPQSREQGPSTYTDSSQSLFVGCPRNLLFLGTSRSFTQPERILVTGESPQTGKCRLWQWKVGSPAQKWNGNGLILVPVMCQTHS